MAAMRLGEGWVNDTFSFAEVSIGAARLQEAIRALGRNKPSVPATIPLGHRILIVIPQEEEHTLGAFIAASQFRRYGVWVHMAIGQNPEEVAQTVRCQGFDMLGISGSGRRSLAPHAEHRRKGARARCPTFRPSSSEETSCNLGVDLMEYSGADLATTNPRKAMEFCGLPLRLPQGKATVSEVT